MSTRTMAISSSQQSSALHDNKYREILDFRCFDNEPIDSTQDETKRLLSELYEENDGALKSSSAIAVLAKQQTSGRGTNGRVWEAPAGNLYLTMAVPLQQIPVTITLLPLQVGVAIAQVLQEYLPQSSPILNTEKEGFPPGIAVKWPNDVLVDHRKIAGVLIENWLSPSNQDIWLLIGVGINVAHAPSLPSGVREATCLQEYHDDRLDNDTTKEMGEKLVYSLLDWISNKAKDKSATEHQVLQDWKSWAQFGQVYKIRETGEEVVTLDIKSDGQLKVRGADGQERYLVADYLH